MSITQVIPAWAGKATYREASKQQTGHLSELIWVSALPQCHVMLESHKGFRTNSVPDHQSLMKRTRLASLASPLASCTMGGCARTLVTYTCIWARLGKVGFESVSLQHYHAVLWVGALKRCADVLLISSWQYSDVTWQTVHELPPPPPPRDPQRRRYHQLSLAGPLTTIDESVPTKSPRLDSAAKGSV